MITPISPGPPVTNNKYPNGDFSTKYGMILQTLTVVGVAIGGFYAGIVTPMQQDIRSLNVDINAMAHEDARKLDALLGSVTLKLDDKIARAEHDEFKARQDNHLGEMEKEITQVRSDLAFLRDNQVTRAEHTTHWDNQKEAIMELRKQVDDLRKDFGGQYTVKDSIKDLQQQLDGLRGRSSSKVQ